MHGSTPIPPDPESERRGHEMRDVAIRPILYFLIGLFVFGGVLETVMRVIMSGFVAQDTKIGVPSGLPEDARLEQEKLLSGSRLHDTGQVGLGSEKAPLQRDTTGDMLNMYKKEDEVLTTYHLDQASGQIRVPMRRAMEIVAKKGLPHRDTPKSQIDNDLPYPIRSEPYMSKY